ncbi:MAG: hypothetical protein LBB94_12180 [Clostridiales bacterium]|jgi:hypothetical protein|nr:hypothetical protein [Clostridiales bacterium]
MSDSMYYLKMLTEYLNSANMFYYYTERLKTISDVMADPHWLNDILNGGYDQAVQRVRMFMSALYGVFPQNRVLELCKNITDYQTGLDGKEILFYVEAALLEVKRYFFRHKKQIAEIMRFCEFPFEQVNQEPLPLARTVQCSYEPYMKPAGLFPLGYGDLKPAAQLPADPSFIEPDRKADVLKYIAPEIREGLLTRGHKDFFSKYADFFSTFFADAALFLDRFTTIPEDVSDKEAVRKDLLEYIGELCGEANIEPERWVDARLLNTWLNREAYEQLKRVMKQYGVTENVLTDGREDIPGWEKRFHAEKVQFQYWKPLAMGFIRMGTNSVSEYQSAALLERAVAEENEQAAAYKERDAYFELLKRMRGVEDEGRFEDLMREHENLLLFADMFADIKKKKIPEDSRLYAYYNIVIGIFFTKGQYRVLIPPVREGDALSALEDVMRPRAAPAFEPGESPVACRIEKTAVAALETGGIKVTAAYPGLMRGREVLSAPFVSIEVPVSPQDKLVELAESLDNIIQESRTEKDILGVCRNINGFIHCMRIIDQKSKSGQELDTQTKREWLNQNHFIYNLFNFTPAEFFSNLKLVLDHYEGALNGRISINEYREPFYTAWGLCITRLNSMGVAETLIEPYKTRVTKNELLNGWNKENTEGREADEGHPPGMVYGVLKRGVEIDGQLVQRPVVNVYA